MAALGEGRSARAVEMSDEEWKLMKGFNLLTSKPVLYLANVSEDDLPEGDNEHVRARGRPWRRAAKWRT